jgi:hypothetical protein
MFLPIGHKKTTQEEKASAKFPAGESFGMMARFAAAFGAIARTRSAAEFSNFFFGVADVP